MQLLHIQINKLDACQSHRSLYCRLIPHSLSASFAPLQMLLTNNQLTASISNRNVAYFGFNTQESE